MKVKIKHSSAKKGSNVPKFNKGEIVIAANGTIILISDKQGKTTDAFSGYCLIGNNDSGDIPFNHSRQWQRDYFDLFTGTITLSND